MFGCVVLAMCGDRDGAANRRRVHDRTAAPRFQHRCDLMFHAMKNAEHVDIQGSLEIGARSEEHTSELQSLMRISYDVFCLIKKTTTACRYLIWNNTHNTNTTHIKYIHP